MIIWQILLSLRRFFAGKENVAFPIKIFISLQVLVLFHRYDVLIVERDLYTTHTLGILVNLVLKNVFRQWVIFPEVAVYTDACAYIDGKLLIYLCLTSKVYIYVEAYGYYALSDKTL